MAKLVLGLFENESAAEGAIKKLEDQGFDPKDVSVVMKDRSAASGVKESTGAKVAEGAISGATTGAVVGGIAGLLAATVLPGLAGFLIGGPIGAALGLTGAAATTVSGIATGAAAGGLIGALTSLGLTEDEAEKYQTRVSEGAILLIVPAEGDTESVEAVFDEFDASDVKTVSSK